MNRYSKEQQSLIKRELSCVLNSDYGPPKKLTFYKEDGSLPLIWAMSNIKDFKVPKFEETKLKSTADIELKLRPLQEQCMLSVEEQMKKDIGGGIINLSTGSGKTVLSLYIVSKYRLKTLVIVNTVELMEQWKESIKKFLPGFTIGIVRGNQFDTDTDITIGMLQTISLRKEYTRDKFKHFSLCFIDECHHLSSEIFSQALFKCRTKYTFGLSATVERRDGLEYVFRYHLGEVIFSDKDHGATKQHTEIQTIKFKGDSSIALELYNGKPKISTMITNIADDRKRNNLIIQTLKDLPGERKVLVLSDRISQLKFLHSKLGKEVSGLFIGKTPKEEKLDSKKKKILLATYNIASEGFDHPELNCLLFATPRSNIVQSMGRIFRKKHNINPLIIDIVDQFSVFPYQYKKRMKLYQGQLGTTEEETKCEFD